MTGHKPKVSVCIATYNQERFIAEAISSALNQTLRDIEVIVCDDVSTDATANIVHGFRDPRLRYVRQASRVGIPANRNACLELARGDYVAWLDSDDIYEPEMLELQASILDANPEVGLAHAAFVPIDEDGRALRPWPLPFDDDVILAGGAALNELTLSNNITAPTVLVRRDAALKAGPYAVDIGGSSTDWDMWLRLAAISDVAYTAAAVARYRQHVGSTSTRTGRTGERLRCDIRVVEKFFARHAGRLACAASLEPRARAALGARALLASAEAFTRGDIPGATTALRDGVRAAPGLRDRCHLIPLFASIAAGDEVEHFTHSRALLQSISQQFSDSRYWQTLRKLITPDPAWDCTLEEVAGRLRRLTPSTAGIAAVDKWDPRLLHLAQRQGWHFPDRRLLPGGYPKDGAEAIRHLYQLVGMGAQYLVIPNFAFWWLDYYAELKHELEAHWQQVCGDPYCVIYRHASAAAAEARP